MTDRARLVCLLLVPWVLSGCQRLVPQQSLELVPTTPITDATALDRAAEVIRSRLTGMPDTQVAATADRITVSFPASADRARFERLCTRRGELNFVLMPTSLRPASADAQVWKDSTTGKSLQAAEALKRGTPAFTGADLQPNAGVIPSDAPNQFEVRFELRDDRKADFKAFTGQHIDDMLVIVLDGKVLMAPVIRTAIPGKGVITGHFSAEEATDLRGVLNSGTLPFDLRVAKAAQPSAP